MCLPCGLYPLIIIILAFFTKLVKEGFKSRIWWHKNIDSFECDARCIADCRMSKNPCLCKKYCVIDCTTPHEY